MCGISAQNFGFPETGRKAIRRFNIFLSDGLSLSGRLKKQKPGIDTRLSLCCPRCFSDGLFLPARAARLNHDIDPFARLATRRLAAADGIDFGAGIVGDDRALGFVAAARYFGVAAQFDDVAGRGVFDLVGFAVYRSFAAV